MAIIVLMNRAGLAVASSVVDDDDHASLSLHAWHMNAGGYAVRSNGSRSSYRTIFMHREIMHLRGPMIKSLVVDHINRDKLDNRKSNLRVVTQSQNILNSKLSKNNTSGVKGVSWHSIGKKWSADIKVNRRKIYLGLYATIAEAAAARKAAHLVCTLTAKG